MRTSWLLAVTVLAFILTPAGVSAFEVPDFTPNAVDPHSYLDESDKQAVNLELQRIRETSHIWGAVLIVGTLDGEPIENVAVETFEKWQLGQKDVDNGLLLVLAMEDRKSRFEVGYGLEGSITDIAALHALDDYLAPKMRAGDTAGAIVDAFGFLSRVVAQDPDAVRELEQQAKTEENDNWTLGFVAWTVLLIAIWFSFPIRNRVVARQRERLKARDPSLSFDAEDVATVRGAKPARKKSYWFIQAFLSVNPGAFVFLLSARSALAFVASVAATLLVMYLVIQLSARKYASPRRYRQFLDELARRRAEMIEKGHLKEKAPGVYEYTPAYHASRRSSSSSSRFSSSSGGGRSGGGGASSGW